MISIVVPIYKVEAFLPRCLDSILTQTYTDTEIILVDDGSPDGCGAICDDYARRDTRIRVLHKTNGGLSEARNAGLKIARGEYISFIDSDDWVHPRFLELLLYALESEHGDIAECDKVVTGNFDPAMPAYAISIEDTHVYGPSEALKLMIDDHIFYQHVWNKLYRRSIIEGLTFSVGKLNEDEFWTYRAFGRSEKLVKIDLPLYFYYQRSSSIIGSQYSYKRLDTLEAKWRRQQYIDRYYPEISMDALTNLYASIIFAGQWSLFYMEGVERRRAIRKVNRFRSHVKVSGSLIRSADSHQKIWFRLSKLSFWGTCRLKNVLKKGLV